MLVLFALITVVLVTVAIHAVRNIHRATAATDWVNRTHALINELEGIAASVQSGDGSLRIYVLSGEARDLASARQAHARLADHVEVATALTRDDPAAHAQIERLATLAGQRAAFAREVGQARSTGDTDKVNTLLSADAGNPALDEIYRATEKLVTEQMALLAERDKESYLRAQTTQWTVWSGVVINFLLLAGGAWLIRDDILARRRAAAVLQEANALLESRVAARTADLTAANTRLSMENLERRWANQALEHQLRYNHLIINSLSDLVLVVTKLANISRINPAVEHLTGRPAKELVNQHLLEIVRLEAGSGKPETDPIGRALREGHDLRELPAFVKDLAGRETAVRLTLYPLRDGNNVVGGVIVLQPDRPSSSPA